MCNPRNPRGIWHIALMFACAALSGCVIVPNVGRSSSAMQGRVVDAQTGQPVAGATVALHRHPRTMAFTDDSGEFHFDATHRFNLLILTCPPASIPNDWHYGNVVDISHPLYEPRALVALAHS